MHCVFIHTFIVLDGFVVGYINNGLNGLILGEE